MRGLKSYQKADIDVVVLTYNHAFYIEANILSILKQKTSYRFNLLIADDCSTDGTRAIVEKWMSQDERVYLVSTDSNVGSVENARNVIGKCQSDYLALCEGDDFWIDDEKLQIQMDYLKRNPEFGMVHGDVCYYHQEKNELGGSVNLSKGVRFPSGDIFEQYLSSDSLFIFTGSVLIERGLFQLCANYDLFKEKKWMAQDLPTWLELSKQTKIAYLDRIFSAYRLSNESASRSRNSDYLYRFHQSIFDVRYYYWKKYSGDLKLKTRLDYMYSLSLLADIRAIKSRKIFFDLVNVKKSGNFHWELKRWLQFLFLSVIVFVCGKRE